MSQTLPLESTYLNPRMEAFDPTYDDERRAQYELLPRLYNRHLGPVLTLALHAPDRLDLSMYGSSCSHLPPGELVRDFARRDRHLDALSIPVGGKGVHLQQALLGALGEVSERLLALLHSTSTEDLVIGSYEALRGRGLNVLGPDSMPLFRSDQYDQPGWPFKRFDLHTPLTWVRGRELLTDEEVFVPAQLVLFHWRRSRQEPRIGYATSGGLAFHTDRRRAILHGLYECFERDAINLRWYCRLPPPLVDLPLEETVRRLSGSATLRLSTPDIATPRVYLNTLDAPIPVLTVITEDESREERAFLAGGGAWGHKERALTQALFEIGQMRTGFGLFGWQWTHIPPDATTADLTNFFDASVLYGFRSQIWRMGWYRSGTVRIPWDRVPSLPTSDHEAYDAVLDWLRRGGHRPIVFDVSDACWPGTAITKVFLPTLTQAFVPAYPYLAHPRFYRLPHELGLTEEPLTSRDINVDPLPFP
ncbi:MAG: Ribosomal protein methylthiotransferase accessory factor [Marmoricola sp.]|jgi:ribosomal protein S12 methylthiotransferase accessory factor|nr:Ribosomal protein methylthiotransferase accessory factor [Marmoricola sp.]